MPVDLGSLGEGDLTLGLYDDAAWMGVVDASSYDSNLPDWDYDSLSRKVLLAMNARQLVAWGCTQQQLRIRLTRTRPLIPPKAAIAATLDVTGDLFVVGYSAVTTSAQFADAELAAEAPFVLRLRAGRYRVEVLRYYEHDHSLEISKEPEPPGADHYAVVFTPSEEATQPFVQIPWSCHFGTHH